MITLDETELSNIFMYLNKQPYESAAPLVSFLAGKMPKKEEEVVSSNTNENP